VNKLIICAALFALSTAVRAQGPFKEGVDYVPIVPAQHTSVAPGKVEVAEVFSYGCPYCANFNPLVQQLKRTLPANAQLVFLPASFLPSEDFPMFARAFCTAELLGLVEKTHDAMFDAVWKTGELSIEDPQTQRLKNPLPSIEDAAQFYHKRTGVPVDKFLATAKSFAVEVKLKADEARVLSFHIPGTPALVINGKFLVSDESAGSPPRMIAVARWLIEQESRAH
jgi:protein dithiol oxidoreductase (disulfide-forming)